MVRGHADHNGPPQLSIVCSVHLSARLQSRRRLQNSQRRSTLRQQVRKRDACSACSDSTPCLSPRGYQLSSESAEEGANATLPGAQGDWITRCAAAARGRPHCIEHPRNDCRQLLETAFLHRAAQRMRLQRPEDVLGDRRGSAARAERTTDQQTSERHRNKRHKTARSRTIGRTCVRDDHAGRVRRRSLHSVSAAVLRRIGQLRRDDDACSSTRRRSTRSNDQDFRSVRLRRSWVAAHAGTRGLDTCGWFSSLRRSLIHALNPHTSHKDKHADRARCKRSAKRQ